PLANIGRFSASTIWMRNPSMVNSMRICSRNRCSTGSVSILFCSSCSSRSSSRSSTISGVCSASGAGISGRGSLSTVSSLRVRWGDGVGEPPWSIGCGLPPSKLIGSLKYRGTIFSCSGVATVTSHITRKNAIMAMPKSAQAIFQEPPWWTPDRRLTRLTMLGRPLAGRREQSLAPELHGQRRGQTLGTGDQTHLDCLVGIGFLVGILLHGRGKGSDETVGGKNPQEGTDQGGGHLLADHAVVRLTEDAHGDDD